ncbi:unnamed protein product [[Candida] boidinii]|uniref:Unnamed protein product n=1 Tax=Candida boidinii TaxID=5477 RepID=A0A9W6SXZ5_CANBO|nr:unnamed protein product [[Candida] boidinii]
MDSESLELIDSEFIDSKTAKDNSKFENEHDLDDDLNAHTNTSTNTNSNTNTNTNTNTNPNKITNTNTNIIELSKESYIKSAKNNENTISNESNKDYLNTNQNQIQNQTTDQIVHELKPQKDNIDSNNDKQEQEPEQEQEEHEDNFRISIRDFGYSLDDPMHYGMPNYNDDDDEDYDDEADEDEYDEEYDDQYYDDEENDHDYYVDYDRLTGSTNNDKWSHLQQESIISHNQIDNHNEQRYNSTNNINNSNKQFVRSDQFGSDEQQDQNQAQEEEEEAEEEEEESGYYAIALYSFEPENENELRLQQNQMIIISYDCGEGWSVARDLYTGETGLVPKDYVQIIDENDLKEMRIEPDIEGYSENYEIYGKSNSSQDNTLVDDEKDQLEVTIEEDENELNEEEEQKDHEIINYQNIGNDIGITPDQISKKIENFKINH